MLRKIRVYGRLAKFLGQRVFEADVASAAEAVRFLVVNFPQLEKHMADQHYRVSVGKYALTMDELHDPAGQQEIKVIPVLVGAGGATGKILAGIGLIALSFLLPGAGAFGTFSIFGQAATAGGILTGIGTAASLVGASLILGGVSQLLTPTPKINQPGTPQDNNDPRKSYSFSGIQNTSRQGTPVPIVYGETLVGSVTISAGIDTVEVYG
jgi:predicted phage tail protein